MNSLIHFFFILIFSVSLFLFSGCDSTSSVNPDDIDNNSEIAISIRYDPNSSFATIAKFADLLIYASDMDSIFTPLTIDSGSIYGTVKNVPAGFNRTLEMGVYDKKYELQYFGSTKVTVEKGKSVYAKIDLYRVDSTGTIIVEGIIIDSIINDTTTIDTFSYEFIKDLLVSMCDTAGVDYMKVMAYLGEDYLEKTIFTENNLPEFKVKVNNAIYYILNGTSNDTLTLTDISTIVVNLCDSAGVDSSLVWMELGDYLYSGPFLHSDIPEIKSNIIKVISGLQYSIVPFDVVLEIISDKSYKAHVDTFLVIEEMGGYNYLKYRTWYKKDLPLLEKRIDDAIAKILNDSDTLTNDIYPLNIDSLLFNMCTYIGANYDKVLDSLDFSNIDTIASSQNDLINKTLSMLLTIHFQINPTSSQIDYAEMKGTLAALSDLFGIHYIYVMDNIVPGYLDKSTIPYQDAKQFIVEVLNTIYKIKF